MVEAKTPPEPITFADAIRRFATSKEERFVADDDLLAAVQQLRDAGAAAKDAKVRDFDARFEILRRIKEADTLVDAGGNVLLTYKVTQRGSRRLLLKGDA